MTSMAGGAVEKRKVLFVASEVSPFAKTGGLADVAGSLPIALEALGLDVRVIMPKYACVRSESDSAIIGNNIKVYFVKNADYFGRKELYGDKFGDYKDNLDRFSFFSRQVLEICKSDGFKPDIIHCNDWQSALVSVYLNTMYKYDPFFEGTKVLFTIHNLAYQGLFDKEEFPKIGLDWSLFHVNYFEYYGKVNLMKAAIIYSDAISTVSPTYSKEILSKEYGCGLEGVLKTRQDSLYGVLNGIDYSIWNPETDKKIYKDYKPGELADKYVNKERLQKDLGLKVDQDIPMIGMISRLADQKGLDLLARTIEDLLNLKVQFVLLGTGDIKYHVLFEKMARMHPKNTSINLKFDAVIAQKIYAASDLFLIPSRYEPCGLSQMISFKYGTIPVVRQTGGLKDSVREFDPKTGQGDGFTFEDYSHEHLFSAIKRGLSVHKQREVWRDLVLKVMALDFSWSASAKKYLDLYSDIIG